jgi:hypothetical protein
VTLAAIFGFSLSNTHARTYAMALQTRFGRFDMENQLIFDLKDLGFPWQYLALGLLVAALMGIIAVLARPKSELRLFCTVWGSLLALWIGVLVSTTYPAYSSLIEAERHGNLSIVEGTVSNFHRRAGFSKERFCVNGRCLQYTPEPVPVSFMNSPLQGGPIIKDGLHVRIGSAGESIVRLEIIGDRHVAAR